MKTRSLLFALLTLLTLGVAACASSRQSGSAAHEVSPRTLLWKVASPHRTLFLAGEVLVLSSNDFPLPGAINKAFSESGELITEGAQAEADPGQVQQLVRSLGVLPADKTLANVLSRDQLAIVKQASAASDLPFDNIAHLQPWLAFVVLRNAAYAKYGIDQKQQLSPYLYGEAERRKLRVSAFETAPDQLKMFAAIPVKEQATWLAMIANELVALPDTRPVIVNAWRTGDTATFARLSDKRFAGHDRLYKLLVSDRNQRWLKDLNDLLAADGDPAFVVVGAGHFFGPGNLLDLLRAEGFVVTQL